MFTHRQNPHTRRNRCRGPIFIALAAAVLGAALTTVAPAASTSKQRTNGGFGWPVKPFDRPHPVRGSFGDPRTIFHSPPTMRGLMSGGGSFSFHQGIDISAPNGTAVYPVMSGVVSHVDREWIRVTSDNGKAFEYWHISPKVRVGQPVDAYRTVLGRIMRPAMHVHLTALEDGRVVNPLVRGRLTPYADTTRPRVESIALRRSAGALLPGFVRGRISIVVEATDTPTMRAPGIWAELPVTPTLIRWRIQKWTGKVMLKGVARDVRESVPGNDSFWSTYARGTYQNMAVFANHYSYLQRGSYLFKLTRGLFDTRKLRDGVYDLVVTATDIRGNSGSLSRRITIHNRPGWH